VAVLVVLTFGIIAGLQALGAPAGIAVIGGIVIAGFIFRLVDRVAGDPSGKDDHRPDPDERRSIF